MAVTRAVAGSLLSACCLLYAGESTTRQPEPTPQQVINSSLPARGDAPVMLEGKVLMLERMSFAFSTKQYHGQFSFEYLRIQRQGEEATIDLINTGPSGFLVGDTVNVRYVPCKTEALRALNYEEIIQNSVISADTKMPIRILSVQQGMVYCDGIIQWPRHEIGKEK